MCCLATQLIALCAGVSTAGASESRDIYPAQVFPQAVIIGAAKVFTDDTETEVIRRTDPCGSNAFCEPDPIPVNTIFPDLRSAKVGRWLPSDAALDVHTGKYDHMGGFLRVILVFEGLLNPPGPMISPYNPRRYGNSPLFGFVEFDIDTNGDSGGNINAPLIRYNGNVARFGGMPVGEVFVDRISTDGRDPDDQYDTYPWIDRSGGDFELQFSGDNITRIDHIRGNDDSTFETEEVWDVHGRFFRRAQGYDVCAGGSYEPEVTVRFAHRVPTDVSTAGLSTNGVAAYRDDPVELSAEDGSTVVTFIYPLTNADYASANAVSVETMDAYDFNANSILEGAEFLSIGAMLELCPTSYEYWGLIEPWLAQEAEDYLQPEHWRMTMLFGTARSRSVIGEGNYIWSDIFPNVFPGDFNGDGFKSNSDANLVAEFIDQFDGDPAYDIDSNGTNGEIELANFGVWFSIYDVNYDGFVDAYDLDYSWQSLGDYDNDGDVDLRDFQAFQVCLPALQEDTTADKLLILCLDAFDSNGDNEVTLADLEAFDGELGGP
ncbi:MAG: hypothetical protein KAV82_16755 [Phycisphaerae bacterium]|nr:hypothetical protein [Phycisphaerae bacterium]